LPFLLPVQISYLIVDIENIYQKSVLHRVIIPKKSNSAIVENPYRRENILYGRVFTLFLAREYIKKRAMTPECQKRPEPW
jgi:hypothetical protein